MLTEIVSPGMPNVPKACTEGDLDEDGDPGYSNAQIKFLSVCNTEMDAGKLIHPKFISLRKAKYFSKATVNR